MPRISRTKLLEYLDTELAEELDLHEILRKCDITEEVRKAVSFNKPKKKV